MAVRRTRVFGWDNDGWRNRAACRHTNADLFFPTGGASVAVDQVHAAKVVCRSCPVRDRCLQFALETNQEAGIWGGTDEDERRRLRRRVARQAAVADRTGDDMTLRVDHAPVGR